MDFKALMARKVMGIPVLYLAGVFVVILAVVAWKMKPAADLSTEDGGEQLADGVDGDQADAETPPVYVANPSYPGYGTGGSQLIPDPNAGEPTPDTNDLWMRRGIEWLAAEGHATADVATIALQKYIGGDQLTVAEGKLRDLAIQHFGLPPDLPSSGGTEVPAPNPPTPVPPKYVAPGFHTVTGPGDDSYSDMARLFYGRGGDNAAVDLIQSFNVSQGHAGPFPVGTRFWIPKYAPARFVKATSTMRTAAQFIAKNPPLNSVKMLQELNDGMKFPVKIGTKVRVA